MYSALSRCGKKVLHLDRNPFYGGFQILILILILENLVIFAQMKVCLYRRQCVNENVSV